MVMGCDGLMRECDSSLELIWFGSPGLHMPALEFIREAGTVKKETGWNGGDI